MANRNITLSLPDDLIRRAKVAAAFRETSVSALVASALSATIGPVEDYDDVWSREIELMATGALHVGPIDWTRDELHER